jgi:hypothetical protein
MGKTEVEDALQRLDMLTQEENLMTVARTFEATHHVNVNVKTTQELTQHVDTKVTVIEEVVRATQELTYDVHADVEVIKEGTRTIDHNVKVTEAGALIFQFLHTHADHPLLHVKTVMDDLRRSLLPDVIISSCG